MSLVVGWHTLAIVVPPAPDSSAMVQSLRLLLQPYLSFFRLDNKWGFFAPSVGKHGRFHYIVEDAAGRRHTFAPSEDSSGSIFRYVMWRELKYFFDEVMEVPEDRGEATVALLCRIHASLHPVSIALLKMQELDYLPEHYLEGHRTLDPSFVSEIALAKGRCDGSPPPPRRPPIRPVRPR